MRTSLLLAAVCSLHVDLSDQLTCLVQKIILVHILFGQIWRACDSSKACQETDDHGIICMGFVSLRNWNESVVLQFYHDRNLLWSNKCQPRGVYFLPANNVRASETSTFHVCNVYARRRLHACVYLCVILQLVVVTLVYIHTSMSVLCVFVCV